MGLLILGVVLFCGLHLVPGLAAPMRQSMIDKMGNGPYRGLFSLLVIGALVLIVLGWRSTPEVLVYQLPPAARTVAMLLMILAFVLFGATHYSTAIKRIIRHPMLTAVAVWSFSHLLSNGTTRALVLFGVLGVWAVVEIVVINKREGAWQKPEAPGLGREIRGLLISLVIFAVAVYLHQYYAGVPLITSPVLD
jgi:uncharacterized membrane protein